MIKLERFELQLTERQRIVANILKILSVQVVDFKVYLWTLISENDLVKSEEYEVRVFSNGSTFSPRKAFPTYIGTTQVDGYDWHWFIQKIENGEVEPKNGQSEPVTVKQTLLEKLFKKNNKDKG